MKFISFICLVLLLIPVLYSLWMLIKCITPSKPTLTKEDFEKYLQSDDYKQKIAIEEKIKKRKEQKEQIHNQKLKEKILKGEYI